MLANCLPDRAINPWPILPIFLRVSAPPRLRFLVRPQMSFSGSDRRLQHSLRTPLADRPRRREQPSAHHRQPLTDAEELGEIRTHHHHRLAGARKVNAESINLSFA